MQINWNRFAPLLAVLVAGVVLLVVGALTGVTELLVTGGMLAAAAAGAIAPTGAISSTPVVPATRRADPDDVDTSPGGVTRRTNRDGFALPDALSAVVLVGILILAALAGFALSGCGASDSEVRRTACDATRLACRACEVAEAEYCGGPEVSTEADGDADEKPCSDVGAGGELPAAAPAPAPDIDRVYPGGGET